MNKAKRNFSIQELMYIRGMNAAIRYVKAGFDPNYTLLNPQSNFGRGFNANVRSYIKDWTP